MSNKEAISDLDGRRRRGGGPKAGSVWESRMKLDQLKCGFKVFNPTEGNSQENSQDDTSPTDPNSSPQDQMDRKENDIKRAKQSLTGSIGKRKTWKSDHSGGSPLQLAKLRSELRRNLDQDFKESGDSSRSPVWIKKNRSISSGEENLKNALQLRKVKSDSSEVVSEEKNDEIKNPEPNRELEGSNREIDKSPDGVGISRSGEDSTHGEKKTDLDGDEKDKEIEVEKKSLDIIKEMPKKIVVEDKKLLHSNGRSALSSPNVRKQPKFHPGPTKSKPITDNFHDAPRPRTHSRLQSFVDLVMWKDVSKSAFVFGIGTFGIISSSYTKDLSISFISGISYIGLVYLAAIFLFRSLITRGTMDADSANQDFAVGEEEAIWVVKLILPYFNEFLLKLRALFSGDPATTMKLAVLLFILARCGSSMTIWKMAKLGFVGVFTVPKIYATYSSQLTAYGTFWIRRFGDAWESCSHKKAIAFAIFTLVWNLSSVIARIWTVFLLFVAIKYYQQSLIKDGWVNEESGANTEGQTMMRSSSSIPETRKQKKVC